MRSPTAGSASIPSASCSATSTATALADLVYVESGRVTIWLNQSGNGWSDPIVIRGTPPVSDIDAVRLADMLGNGTAGILWTYDCRHASPTARTSSSTSPAGSSRTCSTSATTMPARARASTMPRRRGSTSRTSASRRPAGAAALPFPVQVVARVEVIDEISGGKLTTEYRYHHGYWDGEEREFRGFGMVEQLDTETFARYHARACTARRASTRSTPCTSRRRR